MTQIIIVIFIIGTALAYAIYSFVKSINKKNKMNRCDGCTGCDLSKKKDCCK